MMNIFTICTLLTLSCAPQNDKASADQKLVYENLKTKAVEQNTPAAKHKYIIQQLAPQWIGTAWDFNGITQQPREGKIACGYFVTTLLRDAGYKVQRVKWAQTPSSELIKNTCKTNTIKRFTTVKDTDTYMAQFPDYTLAIIGLDFHTGFLYRSNGVTYILHASWYGPKKVVIEKALTANATANNKCYMIGIVK